MTFEDIFIHRWSSLKSSQEAPHRTEQLMPTLLEKYTIQLVWINLNNWLFEYSALNLTKYLDILSYDDQQIVDEQIRRNDTFVD